MRTGDILRLIFIALLWLALVALILTTARVDFFTLFAIVASGIVVFVPLYKKYYGKRDRKG
ncbi:MAG: hypothetical protein HDS64_11780 [Bacteroidales bacterium]|nr:hypothetical protein [Bacteroidales bacterium]MBD5282104.1 hypothetical protein [Bacteroides sp.]MDE6032652.1 hypothetical protein [Muribaculaceae bacterium]MBD5240424.1 hypothetical protein [Bacteroidales bacterium]MBD5293789.1 hypothetical protein [Bacteroides sp.]